MSSAKKTTAAAAEKTDPTDLLDGKTIKDALVRAGLSTKGSVLEMATRLQGHFTSDPEHVKNGSREYDCDVDAGGCGYPFPTNLQTCAFCGRAADEGDKAPPAPPTPVPTSGIVKASGAALTEADEQEKKLDYAVERVRVFSREMVGAGWDLGRTIGQIHEQKLYLARRGPDGKPVHPSFEAFCKAELKMSSVYARNLIDVSTRFTRDQAVSLGTQKLIQIGRVDPGPERDRLLEEAPEKTVAEVGREVRTVVAAQPPKEIDRRGAPLVGAARQGRKMSIGGKRDLPSAEPTPAIYPPPSTFTRSPVAPFLSDAPAPAEGAPPVEEVVVPPPRRLTLAAEEGTYKVLMYAPRRTPHSKPRAQTLADSPKGRIKMLNDTEIVVVVGKSEKGLWVKLSFLELGSAAKKARRAKAALVRAKKRAAAKDSAES